jgi:hypothetical protein
MARHQPARHQSWQRQWHRRRHRRRRHLFSAAIGAGGIGTATGRQRQCSIWRNAASSAIGASAISASGVSTSWHQHRRGIGSASAAIGAESAGVDSAASASGRNRRMAAPRYRGSAITSADVTDAR